jgi:hypothetical protein
MSTPGKTGNYTQPRRRLREKAARVMLLSTAVHTKCRYVGVGGPHILLHTYVHTALLPC